jgi:hypothetical protein
MWQILAMISWQPAQDSLKGIHVIIKKYFVPNSLMWQIYIYAQRLEGERAELGGGWR